MRRSIYICCILLIGFCILIKCNTVEIEEINQRLDELLVDFDSSTLSDAVWIDKKLFPLYNYEFDNENREELIVSNVSSRRDSLIYALNNLQFISNGKNVYLAGSMQSVIFINVMDNKKERIIDQYQITSVEKIETFSIFFPFNGNPHDAPLILVVGIEVIYGSELRWYTFNGNKLEQFWMWPVDSQVGKLKYFQHEGEDRLIVLRNSPNSYQYQIDIYGFGIAGKSLEPCKGNFYRYLEKILMIEVTDIKSCPVFDGTIILLQIREYIFVYKYYTTFSGEEHFDLVQELKFSGLRNVICFNSGNIHYLVTAGLNSSILEYFDDIYQINLASTNNLQNAGEIIWIESIPLDSYREEVLLLIQLQNSSIFILPWQVNGFGKILQPFFTSRLIDLSKIVVIPKVGFIFENEIVKIETQLKEVLPPNYEQIRKSVDTFHELMEIFHKQEMILEDEVKKITESHSKHPIVNGKWNIPGLKIVTNNNTKMNENLKCKSIQFGAINSTCHEFNSSHEEIINSLERINLKLNEIDLNIKNAIAINATDLSSFNNIEIVGDLIITGTISVENLTFNIINNISIDDVHKHFDNHDSVIEGEKFFPSIEVEELSLQSINNIPIDQIILDTELIDYNGINFANIENLEVEGDLNYLDINNINWKSLMKSVIRKSEDAIIPNELIVRGTIKAQNANVEYVNNLKYPDEYVQKSSRDFVSMESEKRFKKLVVEKLDSIKTINKIPITDFILLNGSTTLDKEITFDDLTVFGLLEINGEIKDHERRPIKRFAANEIDADVYFKKVRVHGNVQVIETINNKTWMDFDDLLIRGDDYVEIIGKKTFIGRVEIGPGLNIISQKINGHLIDEFMTLDTYQELPNLKRINSEIKIDRLLESDVIELERLLFENKFQGSNMCLNKHFVFKVSPIVDKISAEFIDGYIPSNIFATKLNESFRNVIIENVNVQNLYVKELKPQTVNGLNYTELLKGNYLNGRKNVGKSRDLSKLKNNLKSLYEKIVNGSAVIRNLTVTGSIKTKTLNGILLTNIYNVSNMESVIFEQDVHIKNLTVHGFINSVNFSEFFNDSVLKTDKNVVITGRKKFDKIICESLEFSSWNNRSIDDILDPTKHQTLTGPIIVKGNVIVEEYFDPTRKIGGILFQDIIKNINYQGNNTYIVNGNFQFNQTVDIDNLFVTENIQNVNFNNFMKSVVFLDSENVTVTGTKIFNNSVSVNNITIIKQFNDINLENYFHDVVRIDKPMSIKAEVIFDDDITIGGDLIIEKNIMAKSIMGIDFQELLANAMYTNKPTIVPGTIKFTNLKIQSDIKVEKINNINMSHLIPLHQEQIIPASLHCHDITVGNLNIMDKLNGHDFNAIFNETFLLTGDQNITGKITFLDEVIVEDFDSKLINNFDPNNLINAEGHAIIVGNFVFNSSVVVNGNLNLKGKFNGKDFSQWKKFVMINDTWGYLNATTQIIHEEMIVHGNVHFFGNIIGSSYINNIHVDELTKGMSKRIPIDKIIRAQRNNLKKTCEDLKYLEKAVERNIYKYKYFDYLQIIKFNDDIVSIHHFEYNNSDYLFVNLKNCHLDYFVFNHNELKFNHVIGIPNFGYINRWLSFKHNEKNYILTLGETKCNRSSGNFWSVINDKLIFITDFVNATDAKKESNNNFFIIINGILKYYSIESILGHVVAPLNEWQFTNKYVKFLPHAKNLLLFDDLSLYQFDKITNRFSVSQNVFQSIRAMSFHVGIFQKELFIYHDKKISKNYIIISNNNFSSNHIVQTINVNRPVSIRMINFEGFIENFLIFIESGNKIQIYEYKGIERFVYRETIRMRANKLYIIKLRMSPGVVKKNCLALLNKNELIILEAKMYGEKYDIDNTVCPNNSSMGKKL